MHRLFLFTWRTAALFNATDTLMFSAVDESGGLVSIRIQQIPKFDYLALPANATIAEIPGAEHLGDAMPGCLPVKWPNFAFHQWVRMKHPVPDDILRVNHAEVKIEDSDIVDIVLKELARKCKIRCPGYVDLPVDRTTFDFHELATVWKSPPANEPQPMPSFRVVTIQDRAVAGRPEIMSTYWHSAELGEMRILNSQKTGLVFVPSSHSHAKRQPVNTGIIAPAIFIVCLNDADMREFWKPSYSAMNTHERLRKLNINISDDAVPYVVRTAAKFRPILQDSLIERIITYSPLSPKRGSPMEIFRRSMLGILINTFPVLPTSALTIWTMNGSASIDDYKDSIISGPLVRDSTVHGYIRDGITLDIDIKNFYSALIVQFGICPSAIDIQSRMAQCDTLAGVAMRYRDYWLALAPAEQMRLANERPLCRYALELIQMRNRNSKSELNETLKHIMTTSIFGPLGSPLTPFYMPVLQSIIIACGRHCMQEIVHFSMAEIQKKDPNAKLLAIQTDGFRVHTTAPGVEYIADQIRQWITSQWPHLMAKIAIYGNTLVHSTNDCLLANITNTALVPSDYTKVTFSNIKQKDRPQWSREWLYRIALKATLAKSDDEACHDVQTLLANNRRELTYSHVPHITNLKLLAFSMKDMALQKLKILRTSGAHMEQCGIVLDTQHDKLTDPARIKSSTEIMLDTWQQVYMTRFLLEPLWNTILAYLPALDLRETGLDWPAKYLTAASAKGAMPMHRSSGESTRTSSSSSGHSNLRRSLKDLVRNSTFSTGSLEHLEFIEKSVDVPSL